MLLPSITLIKKNLGYILLFFASINICFAQATDIYLQLLEGEASHLTLDNQTKAKTEKTPTINTTTSSDGGLPIGLAFEAFFQHLKINYIGSYIYAKRLSSSGKIEIYDFYKKNNDPQAIRTQIIKTSKKK